MDKEDAILFALELVDDRLPYVGSYGFPPISSVFAFENLFYNCKLFAFWHK